jgi:hypothetical protein
MVTTVICQGTGKERKLGQMRFLGDIGKFLLVRLTILILGVATAQCSPIPSQAQPERFWLAGRYDWDRIVVYFDAVQFNGTIPSEAEKIPCPVEVGLFCPVKLPASYIAQFQKGPNAEHFALGDKYDLIVDGNSIATVTLTTLVGFESDEGVGNDSFIGALATLEKDKQDWLSFMKGYLVVRHHRELPGGGAKARQSIRTVYAHLLDEPVRFDIQSKIVELLKDRMKTMATDAERHEAEGVSPSFAIQQFRLADGSLRYYARAGWKSGKGPQAKLIYGLGGWIAPLPTLHVLAVESAAGFEYLPDLLNVIDLGGGNAAIVIGLHGDDSGSLSLVEYRDGLNLTHMRILQTIGAGE